MVCFSSSAPGTFLYCCDFASGAVELVKVIHVLALEYFLSL